MVEYLDNPKLFILTAVSWAPYDDTSDYIDASQYVSVTFNQTSQVIDFTALPAMEGVRDFPQMVRPHDSITGFMTGYWWITGSPRCSLRWEGESKW